MPSRYLGPALLVLLAASAGCVTVGETGTVGSSPGVTETTTTEPPRETGLDGKSTGTASDRPTSASARVTTDTAAVADAKERALAAEREFVTRQLRNESCLDGWGFSGPVVDREASIEAQTDDAFTVSVQQPFWYSEGDTHADTFSTARYRVDADGAERLDGDPVSPC